MQTREALASVSTHVLDYMRSKNIVPNLQVSNSLHHCSSTPCMCNPETVKLNKTASTRGISEYSLLPTFGTNIKDRFSDIQQTYQVRDASNYHGGPGKFIIIKM